MGSLNRILSTNIRRIIIEQSHRAHVGHIGSALSVADILAALYSDVMSIDSPRSAERDRFILSKGHAALALYAAFYLKGWHPETSLGTFCTDGTLFGVHPTHELEGVEFSTGSLGLGLSFGVGAALAARLRKKSHRVFVLVSDAECNTGSLWEASMFAAQHRLSNLVAIVDANNQQAFGYTREVLETDSLKQRWESFGWDAQDVDGHNPQKITTAIQAMNFEFAPPHVLIAHTIFGKGVSYMENQIKWHYCPMSDEEFKIALRDIESVK